MLIPGISVGLMDARQRDVGDRAKVAAMRALDSAAPQPRGRHWRRRAFRRKVVLVGGA